METAWFLIYAELIVARFLVSYSAAMGQHVSHVKLGVRIKYLKTYQKGVKLPMIDALEDHKKKFEYLEVEDTGHDVLNNTENTEIVYKKIEVFLAKYLLN